MSTRASKPKKNDAKVDRRRSESAKKADADRPNVKRSPFDDIKAIRRGLPVSVFATVKDRLNLSEEAICRSLRIPKRTLARRRAAGGKLTPQESELVLRLQSVHGKAEAVLGSQDKASKWLTTPNDALNRQPPIELLDTGPGFNEVLDVLDRIEYGVYS